MCVRESKRATYVNVLFIAMVARGAYCPSDGKC